MPAPIGRDLALTRKQLAQWLPEVLTDATNIEVGELSGPGATGFSSDTLLCDISYRDNSGDQTLGVAIRIHPHEPFVFPEYDLPMQFKVMGALFEVISRRLRQIEVALVTQGAFAIEDKSDASLSS